VSTTLKEVLKLGRDNEMYTAAWGLCEMKIYLRKELQIIARDLFYW